MGDINIEVVNLVPKFLEFFDKSKLTDNIEDKWRVWQTDYHFAAVPPTEEGLVKAKKEFIMVYDRYFTYEGQIREFKHDDTMLIECINSYKKNCY